MKFLILISCLFIISCNYILPLPNYKYAITTIEVNGMACVIVNRVSTNVSGVSCDWGNKERKNIND